MSFELDITRFAERTNSTVGEAARAIKIAVFNSVVNNTRVDTGRLRGNWQTSTAQPILGTTEREDKSGAAVKAEIQQRVTEIGVDYMTNNLPYAAIWEERDGMIAKTMPRIARIVKEVSRRG